MPSRNVIKIDIEHTFYHVYARGHGKKNVFLDDEDYRVFLNLFKRYLCNDGQKDNRGRPYKSLNKMIDLNCYCLMPNHIHLLLYQIDSGAMSKLMHNILSSYSTYFNNKYELSGSIFESRYKASIVSNESYLIYISSYIHRNPKDWLDYNYSSLSYYLRNQSPDWLKPKIILDMFSSSGEYYNFLSENAKYKESFDNILRELANS